MQVQSLHVCARILAPFVLAAGCAPTHDANAGSAGQLCRPACSEARTCCDDHCVNLQNDPQHCGACGAECDTGTFCTGGHCRTPPCETTCAAGSSCCGAECCKPNQLCCDPQGPIDIAPHCLEPNEHDTCPPGCAPLCICAAADTPIATPAGERALASLAPGDLVYSVDRGMLRVVPIARVQRTPVARHRVMRIALASGRVLLVSPGHPTADGRSFGGLFAGDQLDGVTIGSAALVPYQFDATYDILPESDTGAYFAGGVLIGSTLARDKQLVNFSGAWLR
jgi:hypothetical protein